MVQSLAAITDYVYIGDAIYTAIYPAAAGNHQAHSFYTTCCSKMVSQSPDH